MSDHISDYNFSNLPPTISKKELIIDFTIYLLSAPSESRDDFLYFFDSKRYEDKSKRAYEIEALSFINTEMIADTDVEINYNLPLNISTLQEVLTEEEINNLYDYLNTFSYGFDDDFENRYVERWSDYFSKLDIHNFFYLFLEAYGELEITYISYYDQYFNSIIVINGSNLEISDEIEVLVKRLNYINENYRDKQIEHIRHKFVSDLSKSLSSGFGQINFEQVSTEFIFNQVASSTSLALGNLAKGDAHKNHLDAYRLEYFDYLINKNTSSNEGVFQSSGKIWLDLLTILDELDFEVKAPLHVQNRFYLSNERMSAKELCERIIDLKKLDYQYQQLTRCFTQTWNIDSKKIKESNHSFLGTYDKRKYIISKLKQGFRNKYLQSFFKQNLQNN